MLLESVFDKDLIFYVRCQSVGADYQEHISHFIFILKFNGTPIYGASKGAADHLSNMIIELGIIDYNKIKTNK